METTQVTTKKENLPTIPMEMWEGDNLGDNKPAYPSLYLMQPSSKFVAEGIANTGDIVDGSSKAVIAKKGTPLEFFPVMLNSEWWRFKKIDQKDKDKWVMCEKLTLPPPGVGTGWKTEERLEGGVPTKEGRLLRVFVGLIGKVSDGPYMMILKGMNVSAALTLINHADKKMAQKKPYADTIFKLTTGPKEFNGKTQQAMDFLATRVATATELETATEWRSGLIKMRNVALNIKDEDDGAAF